MNEVLNIVYRNDGHEPDWAAVRTALAHVRTTPDFVLDLVKAFYAIYELDEPAEQLTLLYALAEDAS